MGRSTSWANAAQWLLAPAGRPVLRVIATDPVLRSTINERLELELLLTELRRALVTGNVRWSEDEVLVRTVATLLQQCINNEYVWRAGPDEYKTVDRLVGPTPATARWDAIILASLYLRLDRLLEREPDRQRLIGELPEDLRAVASAYLEEVAARNAIRGSIASFGSASRGIQSTVAATYEQYPYPRWLNWEIPAPGTFRGVLASLHPDGRWSDHTQPLDALVAGCGTGSKAVASAIGLGANARVLGVDLSETSLAYATWMSMKHGVSNLEYLRMDLLELPQLGRQFDLVECTGVLHHLRDPAMGAQALAAVTRPGGLVHISLYSESARDEVIRLRQRYEHRIEEISDDEVREFRWRLMQEDPDSVNERLCLRWDFFDLARCRDLLFHPLEHRYSVRSAVRMLSEVGLEFLTIQAPPPSRRRMWTRYPAGEEMRDPEVWHQFELRYPDAFGNLYEIWTCRR